MKFFRPLLYGLLLHYLCPFAYSQPEGLQFESAYFPPIEPNLIKSKFIELDSDMELSTPIDTHQDPLPLEVGSIQFSSKLTYNSEIAIAIFMGWIYQYFLTGNYRQYYPGPPLVMLPNKSTKPGKQKIGGQKPTKPDTKLSKVKKKSNGKNMQKLFQKRPELCTANTATIIHVPIQISLERLKAEFESMGIKWKDVHGDDIPDNFPSEWVWEVTGWVNAALEKHSKSKREEISFNEVLATYDPALPAVARGAYRAFLSGQTTQVNESDRMLVRAWLDYMMVKYYHYYDWRAWLQTSIPDTPVLNSQVCLYDDVREQPTKECKTLFQDSDFSLSCIKEDERPDSFRSNSLWWLIWRLDTLGADAIMAEDFTGVFPNEHVLAFSFPLTLYELFAADSALTGSELLLLEAWLDYATIKIGLNFDWRTELTLITAQPADLGEPPACVAEMLDAPNPGEGSAVNTASVQKLDNPKPDRGFVRRTASIKSEATSQLMQKVLDMDMEQEDAESKKAHPL